MSNWHQLLDRALQGLADLEREGQPVPDWVLIANLHEVAAKKNDLLRRLDNINVDFLQAELAELSIRPAWEKHKEHCLETVRGIVGQIPKPTP